MSQIAELGPLDVQLLKTDEIGERKSGLVVRSAFDGLADECFELFERILMRVKTEGAGNISLDRASTVATQIVSGVMSPVYSQINPDVLGSDLRDLRVATQYGELLVASSQNARSRAVHKLVSGYPSHDFIIDRKQAESLFVRVDQPTEKLTELTHKLVQITFSVRSPHAIFRADSSRKFEDEKNEAATKNEEPNTELDAVRRGNRNGNGARSRKTKKAAKKATTAKRAKRKR